MAKAGRKPKQGESLAFFSSVCVPEKLSLVGFYRKGVGVKKTVFCLVLVFGLLGAVQAGWNQSQKLLSTDGASFDFFGCSVGLDRDVVLIGAWYDDDKGSNSGSAYVFDVMTGDQICKLLPTDGADNDHFGRSVGLNGDTALVGSAGCAYLFDITTGKQLCKLFSADGENEGSFGVLC